MKSVVKEKNKINTKQVEGNILNEQESKILNEGNSNKSKHFLLNIQYRSSNVYC
jgi:hypothetical protein